MRTQYNNDKFQELGIIVYNKDRINYIQLCKKGLAFANRNDVTTISNWLGMGFGAISLVIMMVL